MRWKMKFSVVIPLLLFFGCRTLIRAASSNWDGEGFEKCENIVKNWASSAYKIEIREDKHVLKDLLFFLHVPRTGGRTYYHCFLKNLYPDFLECPRSYDTMRYDPRKTECHLLSTHDDYSVMTKLPEEKTSVVTILRDPVDRVFSAYEFSIEVAARFLVQPNVTSAFKTIQTTKAKGDGISTLDIWPWKYLVPWMIQDLFARRWNPSLIKPTFLLPLRPPPKMSSSDRIELSIVPGTWDKSVSSLVNFPRAIVIVILLFNDFDHFRAPHIILGASEDSQHTKLGICCDMKDARILKGQDASLNSSKPYNAEDILMPLHVYINDPIAHDIIHNGATFQIAGLTNNSYLAESHEVRHCVLKYPNLGQYVLHVAKRRLDAMLYIGLTEYHKESTTIFAHVVGAQVISQFIKSKFSKEFAAANLSELNSSVLPPNSDANNDSSNATNEQSRENVTRTVDIVHENMTAETLMEAYEACVERLRNKMSKKRIDSLENIHINFSKEGRRQVPQVIIQEIASLNQLDLELHKYAKYLFAKQQKPMEPSTDGAEKVEKELSKSYDSRWTVFYLSLLPLFFFLLVATKTALRFKL